MPNMWGDPHPWERAGVTYEAWYRMLRRIAQAHVEADTALHSHFPDVDHPVLSFSFEEFTNARSLPSGASRTSSTPSTATARASSTSWMSLVMESLKRPSSAIVLLAPNDTGDQRGRLSRRSATRVAPGSTLTSAS